MTSSPYHAYIHSFISEIPEQEWNELADSQNPFIQHSFLNALEEHKCVGEEFGWYPCHISIRDEKETLVAAMPMYVKTNYYGEFVFDWNWDNAYKQSGLDYYPKLVISIPYTPATGPRLLVQKDADNPAELKDLLISQALRVAQENKFSSVHWLFTIPSDTDHLRKRGMAIRKGCNFHWHNKGYKDFPDFLAAFTSKKRKNVNRERRRVAEQNIDLKIFRGEEITDELLTHFHRFYTDTFDKKSGLATLNLNFFSNIRNSLGDKMILSMGFYEDRPVAGALFFRGDDTLYGRYWGCEEDFHSLHFETCYYQGLELAINENISHLDPGVQGEHKIPRGFLPTATYSAHWIADNGFRGHITKYCRHEEEMMGEHCKELMELSPYRKES